MRVTGAPRVAIDPRADAWAATWLGDWTADGPLALCPGAAHPTKRWPERHWLALHDALRARGVPLLYLSPVRERHDIPALARRVEEDPLARWASEPLARVAALLGRARGAVTGDTGLMHLAAACGRRVVAMFGSTAPELGFAPAGDGHVVLCRHERCQPCTLHGRERCPLKHFRCMERLQPDAVIQGLEATGALPA